PSPSAPRRPPPPPHPPPPPPAPKTYDPNFVDAPSHNHLICIDCGKVVEFEDDNIEILNDCITRRMGFRPVKQSIRIEACCDTLRVKGVCKDLLQARLTSKKFHKK
ncbi:MAG: Fur family ferric uptake transcriptional regulator, partial [Rubritalea sp.]